MTRHAMLPVAPCQPLVSVVMATCKTDDVRFLRKAVASVLGQTHEAIEFVIVGDGPLGHDIAAYLSSLGDSRIALIHLQQNSGPATARNVGIRAANGDYIAIMDADDICAPDRIEKQLRFLTETQSDLVGSSYFEIDTDDEIIGRKAMPRTCHAIRRLCPYFNPINNPTVLARAQVLKRNRYPENFRRGEDYRLWIRLLRRGYVMRNHGENLLYFRRGAEFFGKRRGLGWAVSEMRNKLTTLGLVRCYMWPGILAFAVATFCVRLLPARLIRLMYRARRARVAPRSPGTRHPHTA